MKFGTLYSYWSTSWACSPDHYLALAEKVASIGFDVLEISADHLYRMSQADIVRLRRAGESLGIGFSVNSGPSREHDLASPDPAVRESGIRYFGTIFEKMVSLGTDTIAGAIYSFWPDDFVRTDREESWALSIDSLKAVAGRAEYHGIRVALEVLNRFESHILNTSDEAVRYCERIGSPNMGILLDTFHMNIEEDDMSAAIRHANARLFHFHVGENNRKLPGMNGTIAWEQVGKALNAIGYDRAVVMEPFMICGGEIGQSIRVWRDLTSGADQVGMDDHIRRSLSFLREVFSA